MIRRHPINARRTGNVLRSYVTRIFATGIVEGVRGEAWLVYDQGSGEYLALTFGTLSLDIKKQHVL